MKYIQPDKPSQNAYIERFNRTLREEVLNAYAFLNIEEARQTIKKWRQDYNSNHPHSALGGLSPITYYDSAVNSGKVQPIKPNTTFSQLTTVL